MQSEGITAGFASNPAVRASDPPVRRANLLIGLAVALALTAPLLNIVATPIAILNRTAAVGLSMLAIACALSVIAWRRDSRMSVRALAIFVAGWTAFFLYGFVWLSRLPAPGPAFASLSCPEFTLPDADGNSVALGEALRGGPVLLVFYRDARDLSCVAQLRQLAAMDAELRRRGVRVLAVSADAPGRSRILASANQVPFPLLSDVHCELIDSLGLKHVGAGASRNGPTGPGKGDVAIPAVFLVGKDRTILWRFASSRVQYRPTTAELLDALDKYAAN